MARNSRTVAAATFIALTCICYAVYGYTFLFEALPTASLYPPPPHAPRAGLHLPLRPLRRQTQFRASFSSHVKRPFYRSPAPPPPTPRCKVPRRRLRTSIRKIGFSAAGSCRGCSGRGAERRRPIRALHSNSRFRCSKQSVRQPPRTSRNVMHAAASPLTRAAATGSYTVQYFVWFFSFLPLALARLPLHASPRPNHITLSLVVAGKQPATQSHSSLPLSHNCPNLMSLQLLHGLPLRAAG
jgi:hypothetical protein